MILNKQKNKTVLESNHCSKTLCYSGIDLGFIVLEEKKEKKQKWYDNEEGLTLRQIILCIVFVVIMVCISIAYNYYVYCDMWFYFKEPWC